jgi:hypothetical protein
LRAARSLPAREAPQAVGGTPQFGASVVDGKGHVGPQGAAELPRAAARVTIVPEPPPEPSLAARSVVPLAAPPAGPQPVFAATSAPPRATRRPRATGTVPRQLSSLRPGPPPRLPTSTPPAGGCPGEGGARTAGRIPLVATAPCRTAGTSRRLHDRCPSSHPSRLPYSIQSDAEAGNRGRVATAAR